MRTWRVLVRLVRWRKKARAVAGKRCIHSGNYLFILSSRYACLAGRFRKGTGLVWRACSRVRMPGALLRQFCQQIDGIQQHGQGVGAPGADMHRVADNLLPSRHALTQGGNLLCQRAARLNINISGQSSSLTTRLMPATATGKIR